VTTLAGAGAAGGLAGALAALGARLDRGFDVVAAAAGLDDALTGADLVVTGEGRLDEGSFAGKVVGGVLGRLRTAGVERGAVIAGCVDPSAEARLPDGVRAWALVDRAADEADAVARAAVLVEEIARDVGRWAPGGAVALGGGPGP